MWSRPRGGCEVSLFVSFCFTTKNCRSNAIGKQPPAHLFKERKGGTGFLRLPRNPASGGAVFSRRTPRAWESALPVPYPPPADPPQTGPLIMTGLVLCLFLKAPLFCRANLRSADREFGTNDGEDRQRTRRFVTAMVWLVYNSRHDPTALKPLRENRPQHATVIHL